MTACAARGGAPGDAGGYPSHPVEFTVPTEPGGSTDLITRALARSLATPLGAQAVVVNRPGKNGTTAGRDVFAAKPDGYRVAVMPQSLFAVGPLFGNDPDAIRVQDMTFVKGLAVEDYVLAVPATSPYHSLRDLQKGAVKYGTTGAGTGSQLAQALLFGLTKVQGTPRHFDGGAPLRAALVSSTVDVGALHIVDAATQVRAGSLRPLVVFASQRVAAFPNVPTAVELGYPVVVDQRRFVAAPAGLPEAVRDKLAHAIDAATASPEYTEMVRHNHIGRWDAPADEVGEQLSESLARYRSLVQQLGVRLTH
ncbi:tripartite-type tricarboxylate transporter receptor subunit TctC [Crossiella equi]|uniref:Tripartite-type tricarboxylate transporter receptor subunit TctC n=1 Tax=Crossiella equi TaxID=130796 RepID=A0ABS5ARY0_9PSEU|nr:tripartite tricarboxylate transporter substrate binding protein [Crossiella equi]MBP2479333.1 tripartite-type tricarboxylate transporter receptor subunit TctC [Crossiella equi]